MHLPRRLLLISVRWFSVLQQILQRISFPSSLYNGRNICSSYCRVFFCISYWFSISNFSNSAVFSKSFWMFWQQPPFPLYLYWCTRWPLESNRKFNVITALRNLAKGYSQTHEITVSENYRIINPSGCYIYRQACLSAAFYGSICTKRGEHFHKNRIYYSAKRCYFRQKRKNNGG